MSIRKDRVIAVTGIMIIRKLESGRLNGVDF